MCWVVQLNLIWQVIYLNCSELEMIFEIFSFSSVGINVNYLLSELMFNNAELLQAQRSHFNTMELC